MGRCFGCVQENCRFQDDCSCSCHKEEDMPMPSARSVHVANLSKEFTIKELEEALDAARKVASDRGREIVDLQTKRAKLMTEVKEIDRQIDTLKKRANQ